MDIERFLNGARVARLATVTEDGQPHLVPVVFVYAGRYIYIMIDEKRKRVAPMQLKRMVNIQAHPQVSILVDRYTENWERLAWVRVDGKARILHRGKAHASAMQLLRAKYAQYRVMEIDRRPVIQITIDRIVHWQAKE